MEEKPLWQVILEARNRLNRIEEEELKKEPTDNLLKKLVTKEDWCERHIQLIEKEVLNRLIN